MKIYIAPSVFIEVEVRGNWLDVEDRSRDRLFKAIDGIKNVAEFTKADYDDEYKP